MSLSGPRCWICNRRLEMTTDQHGHDVGDCPPCRQWIQWAQGKITFYRQARTRRNKTYYAKHRDRMIARTRAWERAHPEHRAAANRRAYLIRRDKAKA